MTSNQTDSHNFFNATDYDPSYWETYLAARPKYSKEFYEQIYAYHSKFGNGAFGTVHDVGTGPGQVAEAVAQRFEHVIASDLNETHLDVARKRTTGLSKDIGFIHHSGDALAERVPASEADMVVAGESLALMDGPKAVEGFAKILRPGGSAAIWYYGRPSFAEADFSKCQPIYDKITTKLFGHVMGSNPKAHAGWKRATDIMASWLDNIPFPEEHWKSVQRHKWNTHLPMTFYDDSACPFTIDRTPAAGAIEQTIEKRDLTFWAEKWDLKEVRRFLEVNLPSLGDSSGKDEEIEGWYAELGAAMGGEHVKRDITWPVVLVLATRR